jgi:hypothetical protein
MTDKARVNQSQNGFLGPVRGDGGAIIAWGRRCRKQTDMRMRATITGEIKRSRCALLTKKGRRSRRIDVEALVPSACLIG